MFLMNHFQAIAEDNGPYGKGPEDYVIYSKKSKICKVYGENAKRNALKICELLNSAFPDGEITDEILDN